jgi:dihydrofolate reductase
VADVAKLIYSTIASLDGYVADESGSFDWAAPDEEVHKFVNNLERRVGTYLYGRRMYEVLAAWETPETFDDPSPVILDYAQIWQGADKVVYSRTLESAATARTRIERNFELDAIGERKASADRDISVGGPELAAQAIRAGLVDEYHVFLAPIIVGGGTRSLPDDAWVELELVDERRFASGFVYLHYQVTARVR